MQPPQAQLLYFKQSGKYYSNAAIELTLEECNGQYYNISDRLRDLSQHKELPGITGNWLEDGGFIVTLQDEIGWPILVKTNNTKVIVEQEKYIPGDDTHHFQKLFTFRESGKFNGKENITLDESCISNGVALTHVIGHKVSDKYKHRGYYILICSPPNKLSGCPHLLLPTH